MRRAARADANQAEIVAALRCAGASVECLHYLGRGIPDLLISYNGQNLLFEIKDGAKPPSARRLTADEADWHQHWRGQVAIVSSVSEAITAVNFALGRAGGG